MSSASTRRWNARFDSAPFLEAVGAVPVPEAAMVGRLPNGRMVTFSPGKPGRVAIMLSRFGSEPIRMRNFGVGQKEQICEWVASGGVSLRRETNRKALIATAPKLLEALKLAVAELERIESHDETENKGPHPLIERCKALIAKAEGTAP